MKNKTRGLWQGESGISTMIGVVIILLLAGTVFGTVQAHYVPEWNKEIENEHLYSVYNDMIALKSDIEDVAVNGEPKSASIHMGARYPDRMFLNNHGEGVAGSLTSDNIDISIEYIIDSPYGQTITTDYTSNRISYEVQGTVDSPKLVYENGVIIRDYDGESASADEQSLINGDEIFIPVLLGDLTSVSSLDTESVAINAITESYKRSGIQSVNIAIDTDYPDVWQELLAGAGTPYTLLASDDFESGGWDGGTGWLYDWWYSGDAAIVTGGAPHEGDYHLRLRRNTGYVDRAVDLSGSVGARLRFWAKARSFEAGEEAYCLVSPNDVDWTIVHIWTDGDDDDQYHFFDIDLSSYELSSEFWIAFQANMSGTGDRLFIDGLEIICWYDAYTYVRVDLDEGKIIFDSNAVRQVDFPADDIIADALYAGMVTLSTQTGPVTGTSVDTTQDYPSILNISIDEGSSVQTQSTITVTVRNATAPFDIHADLTGLTDDPEMYDVLPDYSSPDSISATSWDVPNENSVRWTNITHPSYGNGDAVTISFWVINTENNMQFFTQRVFLRRNNNSWH